MNHDSKVVRLSADTYNEISRIGKFGETVDTVIRRLLGLQGGPPKMAGTRNEQ